MSATPDLTVEATVNVAFGPANSFPATVSVPTPDLTVRVYIDVPEPQRLGIVLISVPWSLT